MKKPFFYRLLRLFMSSNFYASLVLPIFFTELLLIYNYSVEAPISTVNLLFKVFIFMSLIPTIRVINQNFNIFGLHQDILDHNDENKIQKSPL